MHLQGYFKKSLSKIEKQELRDAIDEYRQGSRTTLCAINAN